MHRRDVQLKGGLRLRLHARNNDANKKIKCNYPVIVNLIKFENQNEAFFQKLINITHCMTMTVDYPFDFRSDLMSSSAGYVAAIN